MRLDATFYSQPSPTVARSLIGQRLVRIVDGYRMSGLICETEAYTGPDDLASHAKRRTRRSAIMYGPPGAAYIYFVYGFHHCLNVVTDRDGWPGAVLVRAVIPDEGVEGMRFRRRGIADRHLTDGPGKLCQALDVTLALNGADLTRSPELYLESEIVVHDYRVRATPRIGVRGDELALGRLWRFVWNPTA